MNTPYRDGTTHVVLDPAQVILDQAGKLGNALIVMGSRGLSDVRELLLGGVSTKVLHQAHCPVTILH